MDISPREIGSNAEGDTEIPVTQQHKRRKTSHLDLDNVAHGMQHVPPTLHYEQYNVAWICALPIEMAAACAMLDEVHESPPRQENDTNTYTLGRVQQHNVVIACLPTAQYGTNNAAAVATNLQRTFPSIDVGLMVGIGGAAPSMADIRLGDVVVGTRVMQYDLGKIIQGGQFQRTAVWKIPHHILGTAVSTLRAKHELNPSRIPLILRQKLERQSDFRRPVSPDRLFLTTYDHEGSTAGCDECDASKLVPRSIRSAVGPMVHYGGIASGNQVMRSGVHRDTVSRELGVICFEMEAAGLMDVFPCLPIRGICDYSDSHKSKEWQKYAAATAAAYAKELLECLPQSRTKPQTADLCTSQRNSSHERRMGLLNALNFDQIDSRKVSIKDAHSKTCRWFLKHPLYQAWLDPELLGDHHGFLWIRGKPGAGKSTLMKFAYLQTKSKVRGSHHLTAAFFFNARGERLEKSIYGMFRSLLFQLLERFPDLQTVFDNPDLIAQNQYDCPPLDVVTSLFRSAISNLGQRTVTCFIDALDEADEQQVMDMVEYFEDVAEHSSISGISLRICFSSRHYPYIDIRQGLELVLEDQQDHVADLESYVDSRLRIKDANLLQELRSHIVQRAAGVFLWAVLVVDILNKENRRGRLALRKRLEDIPNGLSKLFKDILTRDNNDMEHLLLSLLWILFAKRPLKPKEYYHALWSGLHLSGLADSEVPDITVSDADTSVVSCVVSSSKGLAEITKAKQPTVQFIHESVRDFLIKDRGIAELWPDFGFDLESPSHERLKKSCNAYLNNPLVLASVSKPLSEAESDGKARSIQDFPFLEYAAQHVLYHANVAAIALPQDQFLTAFQTPTWINIINSFEKFKVRQYSTEASLFYPLAEKGYPELIRTRLNQDSQVHVFGERYCYPLFAALANGNKDAVAALLDAPSSFCDGLNIKEGLYYMKDCKGYRKRTPLTWAAQDGRTSIVMLLLQQNIDVNEADSEGRTALSRASQNGHEAVARLLIDNGADVNSCGKSELTPLFWALVYRHEAVASLLISKGADVNTSDHFGDTPLLRALQNGYETIARLLIDKGADVNTSDRFGDTPLLRALENGYETIARLLIDKGADVNTSNRFGDTPLLQASKNGYEAVVGLLIDKGADINTSNQFGSTPLSWASLNGHKAVAGLLIDKGADVNTLNMRLSRSYWRR